MTTSTDILAAIDSLVAANTNALADSLATTDTKDMKFYKFVFPVEQLLENVKAPKNTNIFETIATLIDMGILDKDDIGMFGEHPEVEEYRKSHD